MPCADAGDAFAAQHALHQGEVLRVGDLHQPRVAGDEHARAAVRAHDGEIVAHRRRRRAARRTPRAARRRETLAASARASAVALDFADNAPPRIGAAQRVRDRQAPARRLLRRASIASTSARTTSRRQARPRGVVDQDDVGAVDRRQTRAHGGRPGRAACHDPHRRPAIRCGAAQVCVLGRDDDDDLLDAGRAPAPRPTSAAPAGRASVMYCLGISPPARSPRPAATISAATLIAGEFLAARVASQHKTLGARFLGALRLGVIGASMVDLNEIPPLVSLAPMAGVTDIPFRRQVKAFGGRYCVSEMVASDQLARERDRHGPPRRRRGRDRAARDPARWPRSALDGRRRAPRRSGRRRRHRHQYGLPGQERRRAALCGSALMRDPDHALRLDRSRPSAPRACR